MNSKKTKNIIILLLFGFFAIKMNAQLPIDKETGKVVFTDIVKLEGMSKKKIYDKAKLWIVSTLKSGDNMVELNGTNSDQIIGTGNITIPNDEISYFVRENLNFKFIVLCKENRLKYIVKNFSLAVQYQVTYVTGIENIDKLRPGKKQKLFENEVRNSTKKYIDLLIMDFKKYMNTDSKDDW